jgi:hypothetical protein
MHDCCRAWWLVAGLFSLVAAACTSALVAPQFMWGWLHAVSTLIDSLFTLDYVADQVQEGGKKPSPEADIIAHGAGSGIRHATGRTGAQACRGLLDLDTYNTAYIDYVGRAAVSKIASKMDWAGDFFSFLGNPGVLKCSKVFGVAMQIFVSQQNRGFLTPLNTAYTPRFWTGPSSEARFRTVSDVWSVTCAYNQYPSIHSNINN